MRRQQSTSTSTVLRVICAWCTIVMVPGSPGAPVSHGICDACMALVTAEEEK